MEKKISVIIPVYNVESYLHRCVDSIINQTYNNLEIILINDGSHDNSGKICDDYASNDSRVIVVHKKNEGSSNARNAGLDISTGDYIAFVDSDDFIIESMLDTMLSYSLEFNIDVVEIKPNTDNTISKSKDKFEIQNKVTSIKRIIESTAFSVWRRLYKSSLIHDLRFIPKIIHQDVFYTMDVLDRIENIGYLNSKLYIYNTDNESIIRSKYTLEKITIGIRATEYIVKNASYIPELKQTINNYITYYYTDHYFLLSRNTHIDPNKIFRKKIRKAIKKSINFKNYNIRSIMAVIFPHRIMEYISSSYKALTSR